MKVSAGFWAAMVFAATTHAADRLASASLRCSKLAELVACADALNMRPNDPVLLVAEADALVQRGRPGEAIGVYRNALSVAPHQASIGNKIEAAELQRRALLEGCRQGTGETALRDCDSAWLPGAADEVGVFKRRGALLQAGNQSSAALDAYLAAGRLKPGERSVARAILSLSDSVGRRDAITLAARGEAFLALGRPAEAVAPLRQAVRLAPDDIGVKRRLRMAERLAAAGRVPNLPNAVAISREANTAPVSAAVPAEPVMVHYSNQAPVTRTN